VAEIRGYLAFYWKEMDAWHEEEEEVFVHPRDPYRRVDALPGARHVRVVVGGETVAETRRPVMLFETHLPTRYYFPPQDVEMDLLVPSAKRTRCPYKGEAAYWSVRAGGRELEDAAWGYPEPIPECPKIRGLVCFYPERVDEFWVDGERLSPP